MTPRSAYLPPRGDVRVGDRERSEAADRLAAHAAAGRLGIEELEQRLERAQAAVLARDLTAVEADLPGRVVSRRGGPPLPLLAAVPALIAAGVLLSIAVGHPVVPPLLLAAFLVWRFGWWSRPSGVWR